MHNSGKVSAGHGIERDFLPHDMRGIGRALKRIYREWPIRHPMLPIWLSIAAIAAAIMLPIVRAIEGGWG